MFAPNIARGRLAAWLAPWLVLATMGLAAEPSGDSSTGDASTGEASAEVASSQTPSPRQAAFFEQHVRPLLAEHCWGCHGADKQQADLRLDSAQFALAGGTSGPAIVAGHPEQSLLIEAVRYQSLEMPPDGPLSAQQVAILERWIADGAVWPSHEAAPREADRFTADDRAYWAFQPMEASSPPDVAQPAWCRTAIDHCVLAELESAGLEPAPQADAATWARRVYLDLTGLAPTRDEIAAFLADRRPGADERLVDRLLADPGYGQHMARLWLDLVRYAESDGFKQDAYRPDAWRYRDYVIRSLNSAKPYGRFVTEQLAGDELHPSTPETRVATGYLRLYLFEYNQRDSMTQWREIQNELTDVTADVFLGLGFACARCHDHKFDPILREDYYRLQAFFAAIMPRDDVVVADDEQQRARDRQMQAWLEASAPLRAELDLIYQPYRERAAAGAIAKFPPEVQAILEKPESERSTLDRQIMYLVERQIQVEYDLIKLNKADQARADAVRQQMAQLPTQPPPPLPAAMGVCDLGRVEPVVTIPGDRRDRNIEPGFLTLLEPGPAQLPDMGSLASTGRRLALAQWLTRPDHPLTWRVMANRLWQHHFGQGLVATPSDFGRLGDPPSHPALLDYLAQRLADPTDGSWKSLQREIVLSSVYRQSSMNPQADHCRDVDPRNTLLWRWEVKRLTAEQLRDNVLRVGGVLDRGLGGPSVDHGATRRSVYGKVLRNSPAELLAAFDAPDGILSVARRIETTSVGQALVMLNSPWSVEQSRAIAQRVMADVPAPSLAVPAERREAEQRQHVEALITRAFQRVLCRDPLPHELIEAREYLNLGKGTEPMVDLARLSQVLMNTSEFCYIE